MICRLSGLHLVTLIYSGVACGPVSALARSPGSIVWLQKVIQKKRNSNVYLRRQPTVPVKGQIGNIWGSLSQILPPQR